MIPFRRRLFWKIYLTLLASLLAVTFLAGLVFWLVGENSAQHLRAMHIRRADQLIPAADGRPGDVAEAIERFSQDMDADISLYAADGTFIAAHGEPISLAAGETGGLEAKLHVLRIDLPDGRVALARLRPPGPSPGRHILAIVSIVAAAVGLAAFPLTSWLTLRLERLRSRVERWGAGEFSLRAEDAGDDEVAIVARTFNAAAARADALLRSQKALLANASHELRSPLARLRVAVELWLARPGSDMRAEIVQNLSEIDALVEEILFASRLDHDNSTQAGGALVDLLGLAAEEAARFDATVCELVEGPGPVDVLGDVTLLRRLVRNLLENALTHGRPPIEITVERVGDKVRFIVSDHGPGIAASERERVFEPFYRPVGRSESSGGWGLGLSLVRQIAVRHGGRAFCEAIPCGGSRMVVELHSPYFCAETPKRKLEQGFRSIGGTG